MPHEEICLPNAGHTLACMIRHRLFENGARFAACVVPHPLDTHLKVVVEADNCKDCILSSLLDARHDIELALRTFASYDAHMLALQDAPTEE